MKTSTTSRSQIQTSIYFTIEIHTQDLSTLPALTKVLEKFNYYHKETAADDNDKVGIMSFWRTNLSATTGAYQCRFRLKGLISDLQAHLFPFSIQKLLIFSSISSAPMHAYHPKKANEHFDALTPQ